MNEEKYTIKKRQACVFGVLHVQYGTNIFYELYTMNIKEELETFKNDVDCEIEAYLDHVIKESKKIDPFFVDMMKYFKKTILAGGKRVRPMMMCWGYKAAGGKNYEKILKTSVSIELIHAFLLMHDDIIDRDDMRRGKKTIHAKYRDYNKRFLLNKDSEHFGQSISIVLGDFIYSLGNQVLFESKFETEYIIQALNKLQSIVGRTCVGEIQDVYMEYKKSVTDEEILNMYENKTAKYTFEGPLHLGAVLAGADDAFCDKLSTYAIPLGIAFQIRDDILGVFGDEKKTGKSAHSDIMEGKKTFMVNRTYENATTDQKSALNDLLGNKDIDAKGIKKFQEIVVDTGARDEVENYMQKLLLQSQKSLSEITLTKEINQFFFGLTTHLNNREN